MPAEKMQPFCPCSRVLNWTSKGLILMDSKDAAASQTGMKTTYFFTTHFC